MVKEFYEEALMLDYSMGLIFGYSGAKFLTPRVPQLKTKKYLKCKGYFTVENKQYNYCM